MQGGETN